MKKLTTAALLIGGAILASQSVLAQPTFVANDLYFGFENQAGGATEDYIINLGAASGIVGASSTVDLSTDFSLANFDAVLGTSASMFGGVVGGLQNTFSPDLYITQLRSGGPGIPSMPGSTLSVNPTRSTDNSAVATLGNLNAPVAGTGFLDASLTWQNYVEPTFKAGTFYGALGVNPDSSIGDGGVLYEDLWYNANSQLSGGSPMQYLGYFTLDLSGSNPSLTFTPTAVPEPTALSLLGGAGLLLLSLRRRLNRNNA